MAGKKKTRKWIKIRHRIVFMVGKPIVNLLVKFKCHAKVDKFEGSKNKDRKFLILYNHQTAFDQFFVALSFYNPVYYVATEDLFSMGFFSKILRYAVAPIPIKKQTTDVSAVMNCIRVAREGGSIAIAPEGNRTFSGKTGYFKPAVVKLAKSLKLPIAIYRIEDGYGVQPRWSDKVRKGGMHAYVKRVIEPEDYLKMSDDELNELLKTELYVDESLPNKEFYSKTSAEYIERAMYYCPNCGLSEFYSNEDTVSCKKCGIKIKYTADKRLIGEDFEFKYKNIAEWYDAQCDFIRAFDTDSNADKLLSEDKTELSEVILYKSKIRMDKDATVKLYGNRIDLEYKNGKLSCDFETADAVTVLGKNKVNIYYKDKVYQLSGNKRLNALKFVNLFNRYKNSHGGTDNEFLGL